MIRPKQALVLIPDYIPWNWTLKIERIDGTLDTVKADTIEASFTKLVTIGIGNFKIRLNNTGAKYGNLWTGGETVYFYADKTDASTLKFKGRADFIKNLLSSEGQFIDIEGRHISFNLSEIYVSKSYSSSDGATVLKDLITTFLSGLGYTSTNVTDPIGTNITVNWSNKPFWECVYDICILTGADCRVDDNKDFHLFKVNSIINRIDAIWEGYNLRELKDFGVDSFYEKTKVIVSSGGDLPIMYTKGTGTREKPVVDSSIKTMQEAEDRATKEYNDLQLSALPPQATVTSYGLPTTEAGENIGIWSPRQQIADYYKIIEITHRVGTKAGLWMSVCKVEKEEKGTSQVLRETKRKELMLTKVENPNRLEFSYNFPFDDTTNIDTQSDTTVSEGKLILATGKTTGTMTTSTKTAVNNITQVELRYEGANLDASTFEVSVNNGVNWETVARNTLKSLTNTGKQLKIRVTLTQTGTTRCEIDSLDLLFK